MQTLRVYPQPCGLTAVGAADEAFLTVVTIYYPPDTWPEGESFYALDELETDRCEIPPEGKTTATVSVRGGAVSDDRPSREHPAERASLLDICAFVLETVDRPNFPALSEAQRACVLRGCAFVAAACGAPPQK